MRSGPALVVLLASAGLAAANLASTGATPGGSDSTSRLAASEIAELQSADLTRLAPAPSRTVVRTEAEFRRAWADRQRSQIVLAADIFLRSCRRGDPIRESPIALTLDGQGHAIRQTCFEKRLLRQDGTGHLRIENLTLTRGGSDGPGAAITTRGEITVVNCDLRQNLSEEPGGAIFSMRRATIIGSRITGNLANDDGGGVYARRGGVQVYDSVISANLVDGSGGAIGSTGDILVVNSHIDGNTTDGDGGAIYADEAGDVTVIDSTVDGNTADGPGGAIFTLDGDVTIINSSLNGNRADDRGGAISGEADVFVVGSTIARNAAVAHVGGGIWSRGNTYIAASTVSNNYAEGAGGGILSAGNLTLVNTTVTNNVSGIAASVGVAGTLEAFGSIIGPARVVDVSGEVQPTDTDCRVFRSSTLGYNVINDASCGLAGPTDILAPDGPGIGVLTDNGGFSETHLPVPGGSAHDVIPAELCTLPAYAARLADLPLLSGLIDPVALLSVDQRGMPRPNGDRCDVGAVESVSTP